MRLPALVVAGLACAGCAGRVGRDYHAPVAEVPASWVAASPAEAASPGVAGAAARDDRADEDDAWWRAYGDARLDSLVGRAFAANASLAAAQAAVREARAAAGIADAADAPSLAADGSAERFRDSPRLPIRTDGRPHSAVITRFDASWELDLWGAVARGREAAAADLAAVQWSEADARCALAAEVVRAVVDERTARRRAAIAERTARFLAERQRLIERRRDAGLATAADLAEATAEVRRAAAARPAWDAVAADARARLAALCGRCAAGSEAADSDDAPGWPDRLPTLPTGAPADVLRRRPDVRRAERELAAATARIGVAEADLYPRLRLGGRIGLGAERLADLVDQRALFWGIAPDLSWQAFDRRAAHRRVEAAEAAADAALARWRAAVLDALRDAVAAAAAVDATHAAVEASDSAAVAALAAWRAREALHAGGETSRLPALDAALHALVVQDEAARRRREALLATATLAKALGRGWAPCAGAVGR